MAKQLRCGYRGPDVAILWRQLYRDGTHVARVWPCEVGSSVVYIVFTQLRDCHQSMLRHFVSPRGVLHTFPVCSPFLAPDSPQFASSFHGSARSGRPA